MAQSVSEVFAVSKKLLTKEGALDCFVDIDSRFYIDPYLLRSVSTPELASSYNRLRTHFEKVISLLVATKQTGDRFWREANRLLTFKELPYVGLGYSKTDTQGSAIGRRLAQELVETAKEIVDAGVRDPVIFELVGLFEDGIGADRISDMVARVILQDLLRFTNRITTKLKITRTTEVEYNTTKFLVPYHRRPILFVPREILTPLPVAYEWYDIDIVCRHNEELRRRVNQIIGNTWKQATNRNRVRKRDLRSVLLNVPDVLRDLVVLYQQKPIKKYDFQRDPAGELIWHDVSRHYAETYPLNLSTYAPVDQNNIVNVVESICEQFTILVEDNGLFKIFYDDARNLRHERFAQLLFYGVADSYCKANDLDLSREPNAGRGPVDFKLSRGYGARVNVEVKYSSNPMLLSGYARQLPTYDEAEKAYHSIYLIIRTTESTKAIDRVLKSRQKALSSGKRAPGVFVVDGRYRVSASKKNQHIN
jgi:hypothetical protein